jgi:glycosyltransferase 2 family protein
VNAARLKAYVPHALVVAFALWCASAFRADLAQLSFGPVLRAWHLVLLAILLSLLNYSLRILRWRVYLARLGHPLSLVFTALTYTAGFAFTLAPGKLGELARARYYQRLAVPVAQVAAAFFVERFMDLLAMLGLAALLIVNMPRFHGAIWSAAGLIGAALCLVAVLLWGKRTATPDASAPRVPARLRGVLAMAHSAMLGARRLLQPDLLLFGFGMGFLAWALEGVGLGVLTSMVPGPQLALGAAVGMYALAVLAGAFSLLPGGLGSTEAVLTALLAARGLPLAQAILVTLMCRLVTLWLAVALGWAAVWALRRQPSALVPSWQ